MAGEGRRHRPGSIHASNLRYQCVAPDDTNPSMALFSVCDRTYVRPFDCQIELPHTLLAAERWPSKKTALRDRRRRTIIYAAISQSKRARTPNKERVLPSSPENGSKADL